MDAKDVKAALKSAREAIRTKDYKAALRHCKGVLKSDKNNYNALVFVGVAAEGIDQSEQAVTAYKKAIDIAPDNPLAWQGLCSFYEKSKKAEHKEELLNIYQKLLELYDSDEERLWETGDKLGRLYEARGLCGDAIDVYTHVLRYVKEPARRSPPLASCTRCLEGLDNPTTEQSQLLLSFYQEMVSSDQGKPAPQEVFIKYIRLLKKTNDDADTILAICVQCSTLYPRAPLPREMAARISLDKAVLDLEKSDFSPEDEQDKLAASGFSTAYTQLFEGVKEMMRQKYTAARDVFQTVLERLRGSVSLRLLLCETLQHLHDKQGINKHAVEGLALLEKPDVSFYGDRSQTKLQLMLYKALSGTQLGGDHLQNVSELITELKQSSLDQTHVLLAEGRMLLARGEHEQCLQLLDAVPSDQVTAADLVLKGQALEGMSKMEESLKMFSEAVVLDDNYPLGHFHLGRLGYEQFIKHSSPIGDTLTHLLKSAKLDPYYSSTFLYLGKYYGNIAKDTSKSLRCYQKAFGLDATNEEAGCLLIDGLVSAGNEDQAVQILESATRQASAGSAKWAWLRLGLHQMSHDDPTSAIVSLQSALRGDPTDVHCWECLGEAYMTRGSYTAALKVFTRATELDPSAMFCYYQMASIKQALGLYDDAVMEYKKILNKDHDYVPALKGLGQTYVLMARAALAEFFHGRAVDYCQEAIQQLTKAASLRPDLSCLWKLLGDTCTILSPVPENLAVMMVPAILTDQSANKDDKVKVNKSQILSTGARCYGMAVKLQPDCSSLWHDLGVNYYQQSQGSVDQIKAKLLVGKAIQSLQKALGLEPSNHKHWTVLGVMAASDMLDLSALAQHCFIKSIQAEANNVTAWTNLGVLYLRGGQIKPAHEAFKVAQSLEPAYMASWIGQAIVAETVGDAEAMDLFRHTTELGNHVEGAIGYGHWVCSLLQDSDKQKMELFSYAIHQMAAVPAASDALSKYLNRVPDDPVAYNLYGLMLERQKLFKSAAAAFNSAIERPATDKTKLQEVRINYARALCLSGQHEASVEQYQKLSAVGHLDVVCGYALALYKSGDHSSSLTVYEQALALANCDADRSHVYAALGMVAYRLGDIDKAKGYLFEGFKSIAPSVLGLQALMCVGLLQRDETLTTAVALELQKMDDLDPEVSAWVEHMVDESGLLAGHLCNRLQNALYLRPDMAGMWRHLSQFLLRDGRRRHRAAARCASKVHVMGKEPGSMALQLGLASLGAGYHSCSDPNRNALKLAQKAVHSQPHTTEPWFLLLAAMSAECQVRTDQSVQSQALSLTTSLMARVEARLSAMTGDKTRLQALHLWCVKQYVLGLVQAGRGKQAEEFLQQAAWLYDSDIHLQGLGAAFRQDKGILQNLIPADPTGLIPEMLVSLYATKNQTQELEETFKQWLGHAGDGPSRLVCLTRLSHWAFRHLSDESPDKWSSMFWETSAQLPRSPAVLLMQAVASLSDSRRQRSARRSLKQAIDLVPEGSLPHTAQLAAQQLLQL